MSTSSTAAVNSSYIVHGNESTTSNTASIAVVAVKCTPVSVVNQLLDEFIMHVKDLMLTISTMSKGKIASTTLNTKENGNRSSSISIKSNNINADEEGMEVDQCVIATRRLIKTAVALQEASAELAVHQQYQCRIERAENVLQQQETAFQELVNTLHSTQGTLDRITRQARAGMKRAEDASNVSVSIEDVVNYAKRIAFSTSAPTNWVPGQPLGLYFAPHPNEIEMRCGMLYSEKEIDNSIMDDETINETNKKPIVNSTLGAPPMKTAWEAGRPVPMDMVQQSSRVIDGSAHVSKKRKMSVFNELDLNLGGDDDSDDDDLISASDTET